MRVTYKDNTMAVFTITTSTYIAATTESATSVMKIDSQPATLAAEDVVATLT